MELAVGVRLFAQGNLPAGVASIVIDVALRQFLRDIRFRGGRGFRGRLRRSFRFLFRLLLFFILRPFWGKALTLVPKLEREVVNYLYYIRENGVYACMKMAAETER